MDEGVSENILNELFVDSRISYTCLWKCRKTALMRPRPCTCSSLSTRGKWFSFDRRSSFTWSLNKIKVEFKFLVILCSLLFLIDNASKTPVSVFEQCLQVYGQVTLTFRYGREDEEVMGLKFCNEAVMCLAQLYPPHERAVPQTNTPLQVGYVDYGFNWRWVHWLTDRYIDEFRGKGKR